MMPDPGPMVLVEDRPPPSRPADLRRAAQRRLTPLVPEGFPLEDALIGLEEAYSNILEHAFGSQDVPQLLVEAYWDLRGLNFVLTDRGTLGGELYFPPTDGEPVEVLRRRASKNRGKLGLHILRRVMDCLCYEVSSGGLNRLSMVKFPFQEHPMEDELLVELRTEGNLARINLKGFVNMDTSDYLAERIDEFAARERVTKFMIDAQDLEYVSSAGVGVFIELYDRYEDKGGRVCFVGLNSSVRRVLDLVGFLAFFGDVADETAAAAYLKE